MKSKPSELSAPQGKLPFVEPVQEQYELLGNPFNSITEFLDFVLHAVPMGELYLFGGVLRDFALFGKAGFKSDIDLVVDGDWSDLSEKLQVRGASMNKFGGLRMTVGGVPVDIWQASNTWAFAQGHVEFHGIDSLLDTTVLNWDAILMNWRTKSFIYRTGYFADINKRHMDVILEQNPNPVGMLVRVLRHMVVKDAATVSPKAAEYIWKSTQLYSFRDISRNELTSYGNCHISKHAYTLFRRGFKMSADVSASVKLDKTKRVTLELQY